MTRVIEIGTEKKPPPQPLKKQYYLSELASSGVVAVVLSSYPVHVPISLLQQHLSLGQFISLGQSQYPIPRS